MTSLANPVSITSILVLGLGACCVDRALAQDTQPSIGDSRLEINRPQEWKAQFLGKLVPPLHKQETGSKKCDVDGCPATTANPAGVPASFGSSQLVLETMLTMLPTSGLTCGKPEKVDLSPEFAQGLGRLARSVLRLARAGPAQSDVNSYVDEFVEVSGLTSADAWRLVAVHRLRKAILESGISHPASDPAVASSQLRARLGTKEMASLLSDAGLSAPKAIYPYLRAKIWAEAWHGFVTLTLFQGRADTLLDTPAGTTRGLFMKFFRDTDCAKWATDRLVSSHVDQNFSSWRPEKVTPAVPVRRKSLYERSFAGLSAYTHNTGKVWRSQPENRWSPFVPKCHNAYAENLFTFRYVRSFLGHWDREHRDREVHCD